MAFFFMSFFIMKNAVITVTNDIAIHMGMDALIACVTSIPAPAAVIVGAPCMKKLLERAIP